MGSEATRQQLTRRDALGLLVAAGSTILDGRAAVGATVERPDLAAVFRANGVAGTFVLYDASADNFTLVNVERARTRFVPASTFKIANSILALETGVVSDENEIVPYGGKPQPFKQWERDMSMREAIALSVVPIYQELARRIGHERYRDWLARLDYGNRQTGTVIDTFWLDGPLEVSAVEQARFVARLATGRLAASPRAQAIARDIIRLETIKGKVLYGKTGWRTSSTPNLGWWTGWVDDNGTISAFALNIDMRDAADAAKRIIIGRALLAEFGVLSG
jgi:beta-lactamase class D